MRSPPTVRHRVFVRDLVLHCRIGVHAHEALQDQRIVITLELDVLREAEAPDQLSTVVCYESLIDAVRGLVAGRHIRLLETLALEILPLCLRDPRVLAARVRIEKPDVIADAAAVGVEFETRRTP